MSRLDLSVSTMPLTASIFPKKNVVKNETFRHSESKIYISAILKRIFKINYALSVLEGQVGLQRMTPPTFAVSVGFGSPKEVLV